MPLRPAIALAIVLLTLIACACKKDEPSSVKPGELAKTPEVAKPAPTPAAAAQPSRTIALEVTDEGFVPAHVKLKVGEPVTIVVTRKTDETCARDILIEGTDIKKALPMGTPVSVDWTPPQAGKVKFGCAMDMMIGGELLVE